MRKLSFLLLLLWLPGIGWAAAEPTHFDVDPSSSKIVVWASTYPDLVFFSGSLKTTANNSLSGRISMQEKQAWGSMRVPSGVWTSVIGAHNKYFGDREIRRWPGATIEIPPTTLPTDCSKANFELTSPLKFKISPEGEMGPLPVSGTLSLKRDHDQLDIEYSAEIPFLDLGMTPLSIWGLQLQKKIRVQVVAIGKQRDG